MGVYNATEAFVDVANRVLVRAATIMVFTTCGSLERTTSPWETIVCILVDAATGSALLATIVIITNRWWLHRWRRWWSRVWRILPFFDRIRCLHCNPTYTSFGIAQITLHSNISSLSPIRTPWVSHYPVINTIFCAVSNSSHTMV